jgi:hypothetical protein
MKKIFFLLFIFLMAGTNKAISGSSGICSAFVNHDSVLAKQALYNGRIWRNLYVNKVIGNQFLFSDKFLTGTVTINDKFFENIMLRYDIYNDEIMIITGNGNILQLNKEMVNGFTIGEHKFIKFEEDSTDILKGYVNVLFDQNISLYVRYKKEITPLKEGRMLESFLQIQQVFVVKGGEVNHIKKKKDFMRLLDDHKQRVRSYMKSNKLRVSKTSPHSFIPVLKFYDSLNR